MHGTCSRMALKTAYFGVCSMVGFLHSVVRERADTRGSGLLEVLVALMVFGVGVLGVTAIGVSARKLAEIAAVRTAQVLAGEMMLDHASGGRAIGRSDTVVIGARRFGVSADTVRIDSGLVEIRVTVGESGSAGSWEVLARRADPRP